MLLPESDYQIMKLTDLFYQKYAAFKEILLKQGRTYACLLFQTHYDYFICIPYRTEISHGNAFHFKKSVRSKVHKSGLDYSKIVIIKDTKYLSDEKAIIDNDEYRETIRNLKRIKREALQYVEDYVSCMTGNKRLHSSEFKRRYQYTALKYFHLELEIEAN